MNYLLRVISDVHLGHEASSVRRVSQLAPLLDGASSVVFNGDTVELRFLQDRPAALELLSELKQLCSEQKIDPLFINGNHDPIVSRMNHLDLANGSVLVTHGDMLFHDISPWSKEASTLGAAHTRELGLLGEDQSLESRLEALKRAALSLENHKSDLPTGRFARLLLLLQECWPPSKPLKILRTWHQTPSKADDIAEMFRPDAKFMLIGHTHYAGIWRRTRRIIINTGGFLFMARPMAVDVEEGALTVRSIIKQRGHFHLGKVLERFELT